MFLGIHTYFFFFYCLLSFLVLKLPWLFHLPENRFTCIDVMKGKEEASFAFSSDGCGIRDCPGGVFLGEQGKSTLKSGFVSRGNPAAQACCAGAELHAALAKRQSREGSDGLMCS